LDREPFDRRPTWPAAVFIVVGAVKHGHEAVMKMQPRGRRPAAPLASFLLALGNRVMRPSSQLNEEDSPSFFFATAAGISSQHRVFLK
jgi:hypothetical protein